MSKVTLEWSTIAVQHHRVTVDREELSENAQQVIAEDAPSFWDSPQWGDLESFLADQEGEETLVDSTVTERDFDAAIIDDDDDDE